ncbi:MAG TPA: hypothetical protein VNJ07_14825 [Chitinophagales bacterium]|nr:hypothetical protein [Chitinophagales bacterium]
MHSKKRTACILLGLFILSVIVRLPTLSRPLSKHHEFCTALALRIMQIWHEAGISTYHFNPVMTYPNAADKFINNHASASGKMLDAEGDYYYVSHPPLAYYLPFFVFKILSLKPDVLPIEAFNLFIHFLCALGVFLILNLSRLPSGGERAGVASSAMPNYNTGAYAAFAIYLFSPGTLWFHSNVYMADILVQLFFIYGVYLVLKFSEDKKQTWLFLSIVNGFLMTYTSWLGVFFCLTVMAWSLWRKDIKQLMAAGFSAAAALALTVFQYSQIAGFSPLMQEWLARFAERGLDASNILSGSIVLGKNYATSYLPLIITAGILLVHSFKRNRQLLTKKITLFMLLSAIPVLLLHLILLDYSGHDFTTLYGGLFLSVLFGVLIGDVMPEIKSKRRAAGMTALAILNLAQYYYINPPGEFSLRGDSYADFHDSGKSIALQSSGDEVLFLKGAKPSPEMIFYAGRNIKQVTDEEDAIKFLKERNRSRGVMFEINKSAEAEVVGKILLP